MSAQDEDQDKQYEATQKKLDDARRKGELPRPIDLTTAAGYGGFLLVAVAVGPAAMLSTGTVLTVLLDQADSLSDLAFGGSAAPPVGGMMLRVATSVSPWFAAPALLALLAVLAQQALVFAPDKLAPKLSRLSPIKAFGNKFGRAGLFEFFKSFVKLLIYSGVLGAFLWAEMPRILGTIRLSAGQVTAELMRLSLGMLFVVLLVSLVLGAVDLLWQRAEHLRQHRMSRKELMDEHKQSEGDPAIKQQRRQKAVSIAMNRMLAEVPKADVVIVNPTHYAVALQWDRSGPGAPVCIAKGVDEIAARIRELAIENGVPIHSDPATARALHAGLEIGQEIGPEHYRAVAAAIRFAEAIRNKVRRR